MDITNWVQYGISGLPGAHETCGIRRCPKINNDVSRSVLELRLGGCDNTMFAVTQVDLARVFDKVHHDDIY